MAFQIEWELEERTYLILFTSFDQKTKTLTVEDVVDLSTGEVVTEEWFEREIIFQKELLDKAEKEARSDQIDGFLSGLSI
jgi:hypothetical protein